jgi:3-phosphoshikimate 1-carboxyvinyltransferase
MKAIFSAPKGLGGECIPPADKSITHRVTLLAAVATGESRVINPLETGDCVSTRRCLEDLGVPVSAFPGGKRPGLRIRGLGLTGFREPAGKLNAGNSGTTLRLLAGLVAGLPIRVVLGGDGSLNSRPMLRIVEPLRDMGADIRGRSGGRYAPLEFMPGSGSLKAANYRLPVASAQVKSALLFAGLRAASASVLTGCIDSRDHTERLFASLGLPLHRDAGALRLDPVTSVPAFEIEVPGDFSSAAFFITGALISGRELIIRGCGLNPTRLGFLRVLREMGARISVRETSVSGGEPVGSIRVEPGELSALQVSEAEVPALIDEIPLLAVLSVFARGRSVVRGAAELRFKESDRIRAIADMLTALGGRVSVFEDGFAIEGPQTLQGGTIDSGGDHRIAMAGAILSAGVGTAVAVKHFEAAAVSYPDFVADFRRLGGRVE